MATTKTQTKTQTFVRIVSIKNHFGIAFMRLMNYDKSQYEKYLDSIAKQEITSIDFWAYRHNTLGQKEKYVQLTLSVDWCLHNKFILEGYGTIELKKNFQGITPEISQAVSAMEEIIEEYELIPTFSVAFSNSVTGNKYDNLMQHLGLIKGTTVPWVNTSELECIYEANPKELQEVSGRLLLSSKEYL